jgi:exodeoxyribonuclease-3
MKIATWNVNSIRARLPRVRAWLEQNRPDVLCIQESKVEDEKFPRAEFESLGYQCTIYGQKTYNGVALLSLAPPENVGKGLPDDGPDSHRRLIAGTFNGIRVVNVYVPNGEAIDSPKFPFKLEWLGKLDRYMRDMCDPNKPILLCGDFNVAPEDRDVHDPDKWRGQVLFHPDERAALAKICGLPLRDALRLRHEDAGLFTWWDYRMGAFHRGWGLRIDLVLVSPPLAERIVDVTIDRESRKGEGASDHAPVIAEIR